MFLMMGLFMAVSSVYGIGNGGKAIKVKSFSTVSVVGSLSVVYEQGDTYELSIGGGNADGAKLVEYNVENGVLNLRLKMNNIVGNVYCEPSGASDVVVRVKAPDVKVFSFVGSGDFTARNMNANSVTFSMSGSGTMSLNNITAKDFVLSNAGSASINIGNLRADAATLSMAGSGDIKANVARAGKLVCSVAGTGYISVSGNADSYIRSVNGSGSIDDRQLASKSKVDARNGIDNGTVKGNRNNGETMFMNLDPRYMNISPEYYKKYKTRSSRQGYVNGILQNP